MACKFYFKNTYIIIFKILGCGEKNAFQEVRAVSRKPFKRPIGSLEEKYVVQQRSREIDGLVIFFRVGGHWDMLFY